jgi:hypothetical protein
MAKIDHRKLRNVLERIDGLSLKRDETIRARFAILTICNITVSKHAMPYLIKTHANSGAQGTQYSVNVN